MLREIAGKELSRFIEETGDGFPAIAHVWQALRHRGRLLGDGGFCWGLLPLTVCEVAGGDPHRAMPLAIAVECLITALDTLDDIEDQDSSSSLWCSCGVPTAANVATFLLFLSQLAVSDLSKRGVPRERVVDVAGVLSEAGVRACGGQQVDLDQASGSTFSEPRYLDMIGRKSAGLVEAICRSGAMLGSAAEADVDLLARFGRNLGMAMQIANDLAGLTVERTDRNDLTARKRTLPIIYALERAPELMRGELEAIFAAGRPIPPSPDESERVREILEWSGAIEYATIVADTFYERSLTCLEELTCAQPDSLRQLLTRLRGSDEK